MNKKGQSDLWRYAGMTMQLLAGIGLFLFLGLKIDEWLDYIVFDLNDYLKKDNDKNKGNVNRHFIIKSDNYFLKIIDKKYDDTWNN